MTATAINKATIRNATNDDIASMLNEVYWGHVHECIIRTTRVNVHITTETVTVKGLGDEVVFGTYAVYWDSVNVHDRHDGMRNETVKVIELNAYILPIPSDEYITAEVVA